MILKQSTAYNRTFKMFAIDGFTALTGATVTVNLSKNGAAFGAAAGAVTEIGNGWYYVALTGTGSGDTGTLGDLVMRCTATSADITEQTDQVCVDLPGASVSSVTGAVASVTAAVTIATQQILVKKNAALSNWTFFLVSSTDHISPKTGATITVQRSIDGGAFADCTNTPATEISNGYYKINLSAADLNGTVIALKYTATGADQGGDIIVTQS